MHFLLFVLAILLNIHLFVVSFSAPSFRPMSKGACTVLPILSRMNGCVRVVLASGSPRRKELIAQLGLTNVSIKVSTFAEDLDKNLFSCPGDYCLATGSKKVEEVAKTFEGQHERTLVIGADTIVEVDGKILEKPVDLADSKRILSLLRNREHLVHTAVIGYANFDDLAQHNPRPLFHTDDGSQSEMRCIFSFVETTRVTFADLSDSDIDAYVALGEGMDKAGSYGIQGVGGQFIKGIQGCYYNVVGLPIHALSNKIVSSFS